MTVVVTSDYRIRPTLSIQEYGRDGGGVSQMDHVAAGPGAARVVVIDDDEDIHVLLELILGLDGRFRLAGQARSGDEGVALVGEILPEVVILDLQMPGIDGLAAIPLIRRAAPGAKIAVLSAFPDPYTLLDVVSRGADVYLDKTRTHSELVPSLLSLLGKRQRGGPRMPSLTG